MYISVMMGPSRGGAAAAGGEAPEQPEPGGFLKCQIFLADFVKKIQIQGRGDRKKRKKSSENNQFTGNFQSLFFFFFRFFYISRKKTVQL